MDPLRALMLQVEWGADEALQATPRRHLRPAPSTMPPTVPQPVPASEPARRAPAAIGIAGALSPEVSSLAAFAAALAAFDGAGLAATATRLVLPAGVPGGLLVVGEAPGAAEDRSGEAFVGPEGQLLRRMLGSIGIDPATALLTYLAPWRPPGGRAPSESEIAACLPFLQRLLALASPRLVLALGSVPSRALLGSAMRRGRWGEIAVAGADPGGLTPIPVLPTANPAVLLKQRQQKAAAWADLRMLRRRMDALTPS